MEKDTGFHKRLHDRHKTERKIIVNLHAEEQSKQSRLENVSLAGALLRSTKEFRACEMTVEFPVGKDNIVRRFGSIVRSWREGESCWIAVLFKEELTKFEIGGVLNTWDSPMLEYIRTFDLARIDRSEVLGELQQIKACSNNGFIWSMAATITITAGLWALVLQETLDKTSASAGMAGVFLFFCVAAFYDSQNARAMNKREGFIAALDYYLLLKEGPPHYRGWINLKHCLSECAFRCRTGLCPKMIVAKSTGSCRDTGVRKTGFIKEKKKFFLLSADPFLSLSNAITILVFTALVLLTSVLLDGVLEQTFEISSIWTITGISFGFFLGFATGRTRHFMAVIVISVIVLLVVKLAFPQHTLSCAVVMGVSLFFGSIGRCLVHQIIELHTGQHSFEAQAHIWWEVLENCVFPPQATYEGVWALNERERTVRRLVSHMTRKFFG